MPSSSPDHRDCHLGFRTADISVYMSKTADMSVYMSKTADMAVYMSNTAVMAA